HDRFRLGDPARIIDRGLERDGNQRADAGTTHQPPANLVIAHNPKHLAMQLLELAPKRSSRLQHRARDPLQHCLASSTWLPCKMPRPPGHQATSFTGHYR